MSNYHYIREGFKFQYLSVFGVTPKDFENQLLELSNQGEFFFQSELLNLIDRKEILCKSNQ